MAAPAAHSSDYRAARTGAAWVDLSAREQLRVTGPDRISFVQGMVTNDVEALAVGAACPAALCTAKGAMVGDARVVRLEEELLLDTGPGQAATVKAFLEKYLISEEAEVHLAGDVAALGLWGPQGEGLLDRVPAAARVAVLPALVGPGVDVLLRREALDAVRAALGGVPRLSEDTLEVLRVEAGVPRFGQDMTETTIPLEANLEKAISYTKGCYIGQEVIARGTHRGQMNKKLMGLLLGDAAPERGAELRAGDRKVGWLTSVVRSEAKGQHIALGYVHRDFLAPGTELAVATGGKAVVAVLPFV